MSVQSQIKKDWELAIKKSIKPIFIDRSNEIEIAIDCNGNEYFLKPEYETAKTYRVFRPDGINCTVYKKGFRKRWVSNDYVLSKINW